MSAYHDAELDSSERSAVETHLEGCADCREELAVVESVVKSLKTLPPVTLSKDFSLDIESLIKLSEADTAKQSEVVSAKQPAPAASNVVSISKKKPILWLAAAAVVATLMVATYFGTTGGGTPVVASRDGAAPAVKDAQQVTPEIETQEKPLVADSEVTPSDVAPVVPNQSIAIKSPVAANPPAKEVAHSPAPLVAVKKNLPKPTVVHVDDLADNQALLAFSELNEEGDPYDNSGISTDEDGLYAIKM